MTRIVTLVLFLNLMTGAFSQPRKGTATVLGFDRIGLYLNQSLSMDIGPNQLDFGLRYYGPDYVFERNIVGMSLGYGRILYDAGGKWIIIPGLQGAFFRENKTSTELYVSVINVQNRIGWRITPGLTLFAGTGFGIVINKTNSHVTGETYVNPYFNYVAELGLSVRWQGKEKNE